MFASLTDRQTYKLLLRTYLPYWLMAISLGLPLGITTYITGMYIVESEPFAYIGSFIVVKLTLDELRNNLGL